MEGIQPVHVLYLGTPVTDIGPSAWEVLVAAESWPGNADRGCPPHPY